MCHWTKCPKQRHFCSKTSDFAQFKLFSVPNPRQLDINQPESRRYPLDAQSPQQRYRVSPSVLALDHSDIRIHSANEAPNYAQLNQRLLRYPSVPSFDKIRRRTHPKDFSFSHDQTHLDWGNLHQRNRPRMHKVPERTVWKELNKKETQRAGRSKNETTHLRIRIGSGRRSNDRRIASQPAKYYLQCAWF